MTRKGPIPKPIKDRFEPKFMVTPGCWLWTAARTIHGYGTFNIGGTQIGAHRASYELYVGPIPDGMEVLHRCDNPRCVNPAHLRLGTQQENMQEMHAKGRGKPKQGIQNHFAKLTEDQVLSIFSDTRTYRVISADYGISIGVISNIKTRKIWSHLLKQAA